MVDTVTIKESFQQPTLLPFCLAKLIIKIISNLGIKEEKSKENSRPSWKDLKITRRVISPVLTNKEEYVKKGQKILLSSYH